MGTRMCFWMLLGLFALLETAKGNSLRDPYICGQPQCTPSEKFQYVINTIYLYEYNVTVNTWFSKASENQSTLDINAQISLEFYSPCEGTLKILSAKMFDQNEEFVQERQESFNSTVAHNIMKFAFHDGSITEICPQEEEEDWVINFKRGILSAFQNTMSRFDMTQNSMEKDIHGTCIAKYEMVGQENTSLIIMKKKDLTQCSDRYKYLSILQTVRYNFQSKYQTWPVLQSESRCKIVVDHNVYKTVNCRERHLFEPFSGKTSGAMTTVIQNLYLVSETNKTSQDIMATKNDGWNEIKHRYSLSYHHIPLVRQHFGELKQSRDILKFMCKLEKSNFLMEFDVSSEENTTSKVDEDIEGKTLVKLWGELVRSSRALPYSSLSTLLNRASSICPQARKHILDALPYIASVGSVQLIKEMILAGTASEEIKEEWLRSMALIPRPRKEMLLSMGDLLKIHPSNKSISLAASSMVHSYCRNSKKTLNECCEEDQNTFIINIFQNNIIGVLGHGSEDLSREDRQTITISIKALGNIGGFSPSFRDSLINIIENTKLAISIRLDAVDAFRKTQCAETRSYFLHVFGEQSINVEIRLAAYLQVMRCPKYTTVLEILRILKIEKIQQVASFVWSHLENLEKSTIPSRVEKQGLLSGNHIPQPDFRPDIRMFSRNYEHGIFFDEYNAGGNYEANVILSPESYIPRSAAINLTVDMFGESINLLELHARGEGFETYFERLFNDSGPFNKNNIRSELSKLRVFRENNPNDAINEKIDSLNNKTSGRGDNSPLLNFGVKVFGNEFAYWNMEGNEEIKDTMSKLNPFYHINKVLSGKEISYKKSSLFLDTIFSLPTGCGLPLNMNLMGTSVVNIKMSGSMIGLDKVLQTKSLQFQGKIHPSMALNVAATMSVTSGPGLGGTGIRLNFKLHTATATEASVDIKEGKFAAINISLPHNKQEIFEVSSEILVLHGNKEIRQLGLKENKVEQSTCSWSLVDKAIGVKICATYDFPNMTGVKDQPYFVMAGPAKYLLSLEKVDPSAKTYNILYSWTSNKNTSILNLSFDTPGSKTKRIFNSTITSSVDSGIAAMSFQSADHFLKAHAKYKNFVDNKLLECVLDIDGQKHFDTVFSVVRTVQKNGFVYIPRVHIAVNNERITELSGTLRLAQKKGVSQCDVSLEFQTKRLASRLIGYITWNGPSKGAKLRLDYQFLNERKETIKLDGLLSNRDITIRKDLYVEFGLEFSSYPHLNFFTDLKYMGTPNHVECTANLSPSRELRGVNSRLQYSMAKHKTLQGFKLSHHLKLLKPFLDLQFNFDEDGALRTLATTARYDKTSKNDGLVGVWGKVYFPRDDKLYIEADLNMTVPTFTPMILQLKLHEKRINEYDFSAHTIWFTGTDVGLIAVYQDQSTSHLSSRRLKAVVSSSTFKEVAIESRITQDNNKIDISIKADQDKNKYGFMTRYSSYSEGNFSCYGQVEYIEKLYTINLQADFHNDSNLIADIHFDNIRDVHITYMKINTPERKKIKGDVNWDANRDPNQKVSLEAEFLNKGLLSYAGSFYLFYPGRLINGDFDFMVKDWLCQWFLKLGWSPDDNVLWRVKMFSESEKETMYALLSEMDTPFLGWRDTSLNIMWKYLDNFQLLNGNMTWEQDKLVFGVEGDYLLKTNEVFGEIKALINSTFEALPNIAAITRHHHVWKKSADTLLSFDYNNDGLMMLNSSWKIDKGDETNNIIGRMEIKSPLQGYRKCLFDTNFSYTSKRDIKGLTHLSLEENVFKIVVDGHLRRFTNNMLAVNITSPIATYSLVTARFGIVDTDRHLVAMIHAPNVTTGVEIIIMLESSRNFNVFGHIALPIDVLQNAMLRAKKNSEEIDFRVGWGKLDFGFTGIWHYNSNIDFQYLYKVYTPFKDYEESGLVFKNIHIDGLDSEVSLRLSKHKIGFAILLKNDGKGILDVVDDFTKNKPANIMVSLFPDFSTDVFITVDSLLYSTVKFTAQINKKNGEDDVEIIVLQAELKLPNTEKITLTNKFILEDLTTMSNELKVYTPFPSVREIHFNQIINCVLEENYNISMVLLVKNTTTLHENTLTILYTIDTGEDEDYKNHVGIIKAKTVLDVLPFFTLQFDGHFDEIIMKLSTNIETLAFNMKTAGQLELDVDFFDADGSINITSPYVDPYSLVTHVRYGSNDIEKNLIGNLKLNHGSHLNYIKSSVTWGMNITDHLNLKVQCSLAPVIPPSEIGFVISNDPSETLRVIHGEARIGSKDTLYSIDAEQRIGVTKVVILSPHKGFKNINLTSEVLKDDKIRGTLKTETAVFDINGNITKKNPYEIVAVLKPVGGGEVYTVVLRSAMTDEKFSLSATLIGAMQFTLNLARLHNKTDSEVLVQIDSSNVALKEIYVKTAVKLNPDNHVTFKGEVKTPLKNLKHASTSGNLFLSQKEGLILYTYNMSKLAGNADIQWRFLENDLFLKTFGKHITESDNQDVKFKAYYFGNKTSETKTTIMNTGFLFDIDKKLKISTDGKAVFTPDKIHSELALFLPKPNVDWRTVQLLYTNLNNVTNLDVAYKSDVSKDLYSIKGKIVEPLENFHADVKVDWGKADDFQSVAGDLNLRIKNNSTYIFSCDLNTPYYKNEETLKINGVYDNSVPEFCIIRSTVYQPGKLQIINVDFTYGGSKYSFGGVNTTTPFANLPWLMAETYISNEGELLENILKFQWPNSTALVNSTHSIRNGADNSVNHRGLISLEIPLSTQHYINGKYSFDENPTTSKGKCNFFYNEKQFIEGLYNKISTVIEGLNNDDINIEIDTDFKPLGINYIHSYNKDETIDIKQTSVYELRNVTQFNLTGRIESHPWNTGREVKLMLFKGNRTIGFENRYESKDKDLLQSSRIEWNPKTWFYYDFHISNTTKDEDESQEITINVKYPRRIFTLVADYHLQDTLLQGTADFNWTVRSRQKNVRIDGRWENPNSKDLNLHDVKFGLSHPSFDKDITVHAKYMSDLGTNSNLSIELDYSRYENDKLQFYSSLMDNSHGPTRKYIFNIDAKHPATNLNLVVKSDLDMQYKIYSLDNYYKFKKTLFYEKTKRTAAHLDLINKNLQYARTKDHEWFVLDSTWNLTYPDYKIYSTVNRTSGNDTGIFILAARDRYIKGHFNRSDDVSYHLIGKIVDARYADFEAWRDYEDSKTVDVASYIRLNHSRLLTSRTDWRPQIYQEVRSFLLVALRDFYEQAHEVVLLWQNVPRETHSVLKNVWSDVKPKVNQLLDDLNDFHLIKDDIEEFHEFLNSSYSDNEFYVKDIVEFGMSIVDQLSLRDQLESLPGIIRELSQMMGEKTESLRNSILWIVNTIKQSYATLIQKVNSVLEADIMEKVSELMEAAILKYDSFIRQLQLSVVHYFDVVWRNLMDKINTFWGNLLKSAEPMFLRVTHYLEDFIWKISREAFDFFYARTNELTDSPFFVAISNFAHDLDRFYKDMLYNDAMTNLKIYSNNAWNIFNQRVLVHIPFQKEFKEITSEIWNELNKLQELTIVKTIKAKFWEAKTRLQWWYDYFKVGDGIRAVSKVLYKKITESIRNAIQNEELHRKGKTNFIFDPRHGVMLLEQKLPAPWHAFNRTPDITQISEYKTVHDFLDKWVWTNKSILTSLYELAPYRNLENIFPPFAGHSIITGYGTIVTMDRKVFSLTDPGTFLLMTDYKSRNFTILMESHLHYYNLVLLADRSMIHIDLFEENASLDRMKILTLPARVNNWIIHRTEDNFEIDNVDGVVIKCNLLYKTCVIEIDGFYFARIGGLSGTMNNEPSDDMLTPWMSLPASVEEFADSWKILDGSEKVDDNSKLFANETVCEAYFLNRVSPLKDCFDMIDSTSFYDECNTGIDPCVLAFAYMKLCFLDNIPTQIPEKCMQCIAPNGEIVEEGDFNFNIQIPNSTDVVLIIEAHECNQNIRERKNIDLLVNSLNRKLTDNGYENNRFTVVGYGGHGVYSTPHTLYTDSKAFVDAGSVGSVVDHIEIEPVANSFNYRADAFEALSHASKIKFRPGITKTFLLFPCSRCDGLSLKFDYTVVHQVLLDSSITLHIIMNDELYMVKRKVAKTLLGIDHDLAYTTKDVRELKGDGELRKQVKLPKAKLGYCSSLAMETNGTIFAGNKMLSNDTTSARRSIGVFTSRAAKITRLCDQARCECQSSRLKCSTCPRRLQQSPMGDISLSMWDSSEMNDFIDNFLDLNSNPGF